MRVQTQTNFQLRDPSKSLEMSDSARQNAYDHRQHETDGAQPLTPMDLLRLRARFCASGRVADFQIWVIFLISCKLFLRSNEATGHVSNEKGEKKYTGLQFTDDPNTDSLNRAISGVENHVVTRLAFNICGKTDTKTGPKTLTLWPDDENPSLCPVRHLLVYIYWIKLKKGPLFPTSEELDNPPSDGHYKTYLDYQTYMNQVTTSCTELFTGRDGHFGTHSARKTGYLLAVWGGGELDVIKQSARHTLSESHTAEKYFKDSQLLLEIAKQNGTDFRLARWKSILVVGRKLAAGLNARQSRGVKTVYQLAKNFLELVCEVDPNSPSFQLHYVLQTAMDFRTRAVGMGLVRKHKFFFN